MDGPYITRDRGKKKVEVVAVLNQAHAMKTYGAVEIQLCAFLTSAGGEYSAYCNSHSTHSTP
jgi:hypothetical protein